MTNHTICLMFFEEETKTREGELELVGTQSASSSNTQRSVMKKNVVKADEKLSVCEEVYSIVYAAELEQAERVGKLNIPGIIINGQPLLLKITSLKVNGTFAYYLLYPLYRHMYMPML